MIVCAFFNSFFFRFFLAHFFLFQVCSYGTSKSLFRVFELYSVCCFICLSLSCCDFLEGLGFIVAVGK